jgi:short-subunit dehydrogenase
MKDKVIVITGASGGIGAAVTEMLGQQGARLVLAARSQKNLDTLAEKVRQSGGEALVIPTDMGNPDQVKALAQQTLAHYGRVDILINNAGYGQYGPLTELTEDQIRQQFEVNIIGLLLLTQRLVPTMRLQRQGRIINIGSIAGVVTLPFGGIYHASKHALEALSDALRMELAPFNIYVSLIQPGPVKTQFFSTAADTAGQANPVGSPYAAIYPQVQNRYKEFESQGIEVGEVVKVIRQALTDSPPKDRYLAYNGGPLLLGLMKNLPASITDGIYKGLFGLDHPL